MLIQKKTEGNSDNFGTPNEIYQRCLKLWGFNFCTLDICADKNNSKCDLFLTEEIDALSRNWIVKKAKKANKYFTIWCNPPHSKTKLFVKKAFEQWSRFDMNIIMLIPLNTLSSNYANEYILPYAKIKFLTGRIKFLDPITGLTSKYPSVNGYCTILFKSRRN